MPPGDTHVWRYMSLEAVSETIKSRKLRFTRVDKFPDRFEASVPKQEWDNQTVLFIGAASRRHMFDAIAPHYPGMSPLPPPDEDPWARVRRLRIAMAVSSHASCWSTGAESELLWKLYCSDCSDNGRQGMGVAFRSTLARLEKSVAVHDLYVSPIRYLN